MSTVASSSFTIPSRSGEVLTQVISGLQRLASTVTENNSGFDLRGRDNANRLV